MVAAAARSVAVTNTTRIFEIRLLRYDMQAEPEAVDNTSLTGDETTIVSNQQSMLTVWDMATWSRTIIAKLP